MTAQENIEHLLHASAWLGRSPGLQRMTALLEKLGNPQNDLKFIHIAGTNGKGSTAAMTASVLTAAGYKTALFTSPHLVRLSERFQIDGVEIADETLEAVAQQVLAAAGNIGPTEFELMTAIGFCYFAQEHCQLVVLEVGLGGRLDASNVILPPEVAVITAIGLDHTTFLGNTPAAIAAEKAGILKSGSPCVLAYQGEDVVQVVSDRCATLDIPLSITRPDQLRPLAQGVWGQRFCYCGLEVEIPLLGGHQMANAMVVLEVVRLLRQRGWSIEEKAVLTGFRCVCWPGRMEVLSREPDIIVDGGHNPQCLEVLMEGLKTLYPHQKCIFVMGILADKNVDEMVSLVLPLAKQVVAITPDSPRALSAEKLAQQFQERGILATSAATVREGMDLARRLAGSDDVICAFGSLYTVGEVRASVMTSHNRIDK